MIFACSDIIVKGVDKLNSVLYPSIPIVIITMGINTFLLHRETKRWKILLLPSVFLFIVLGGTGYYLLQTLGGDRGWGGILLFDVSIFASLWLVMFNNITYKYKKKSILWSLFIGVFSVIGSLVLGFFSIVLKSCIIEAIN